MTQEAQKIPVFKSFFSSNVLERCESHIDQTVTALTQRIEKYTPAECVLFDSDFSPKQLLQTF